MKMMISNSRMIISHHVLMKLSSCVGILVLLACLLYSLSALAVVEDCCAAKDQNRPNVIVILTDDLGYGDIGVNGSRIATPNIDYLANTGVQFSSFYASANVCTPSRAGLLTGRYPIRTGLAYGVISSKDTHGLKSDEVTIAEALKNQGYRTAAIGKWHLGHTEEHWPTLHGFDYFYGLPYSNDQSPLALYRNDKIINDTVDQSRLTQQYTEETIDVITEQNDAPFFIYLAHTFPHIPLSVPQELLGTSEAGLYGDVVEHLDWSTGQIVSALRKVNKLQNTLIIVTSDNGPWFEGSSGSLRGGKGSSWEGAYRVPFILSWPAEVESKRSVAMSMNIDVLPTILDALGADFDDEVKLDGKSLMPILKGKTDRSPHDYLLFFNNEEVVGVRDERWKLLTRNYYRKDYAAFDKFYEDGYWLLWDMLDPFPERYSMASREPEALKRLRNKLHEAQQEFDPLRTRSPMQVRY